MAGTADTRQHWLPAAVIGGFATNTTRRSARDRPLHVIRRGQQRPFIATANNLAYGVGMYDLRDELAAYGLPQDSLDSTWAGYERRLPVALAEVAADSPYYAFEAWMKVLLPYVAGLGVRAPTYGTSDSSVMLQTSRWMEHARILAPLMWADWFHLVAPPDMRFIMNDRGFCWSTGGPERVGIIAPIAPTSALLILPAGDKTETIGIRLDGRWIAYLQRESLSREKMHDINKALAADAVSWIASGRLEDVEGMTFGEPDLGRFAFSGPGWPAIGPLGKHDRDWAAALQLAGIPLDSDDWQPLGIFSSEPTGVRPAIAHGHPTIEIEF